MLRLLPDPTWWLWLFDVSLLLLLLLLLLLRTAGAQEDVGQVLQTVREACDIQHLPYRYAGPRPPPLNCPQTLTGLCAIEAVGCMYWGV
jgi:hypothetical protein